MNITGVTFFKPGFAITEVIKPCPAEMFVIAEFFNLILVLEEA
jgi:hypothetical protein